ncbi:MAG: thiamine-monophosphate kinase [Candidatus Omnitrophica bacterium]|nr:thiamine-monophosphate kinase [Candidatus Omnitrophota bacterium]
MSKGTSKRSGEEKLIADISKIVGQQGRDVISGIGDDCAVIRYRPGRYLLLAQDMLIDGVHFELSEVTPQEIGHKALAVNLSDIAAMAGTPKYALVSLGLPKRVSRSFVINLYKGMRRLGCRFGVEIVGGDTNRSKALVVDVTIVGEVRQDNLVLRRGAKPGDAIYVTGTLGGSGGGKHLNFIPRINEAQTLKRFVDLHSMIDISDGVAKDLVHLIRGENLGAIIEEDKIPISKGCNSIEKALTEGEDFELLFTVSKSDSGRLEKKSRRLLSIPVTRIGEIVKRPASIRIRRKNGNIRSLKQKGFSHF